MVERLPSILEFYLGQAVQKMQEPGSDGGIAWKEYLQALIPFAVQHWQNFEEPSVFFGSLSLPDSPAVFSTLLASPECSFSNLFTPTSAVVSSSSEQRASLLLLFTRVLVQLLDRSPTMNHCQELAPFLWLVLKAPHLSVNEFRSLLLLQSQVSDGCLSFFLSEKDDFRLWENLCCFFQRGSSAVPAQGLPEDPPRRPPFGPEQVANTAQSFLFNFFRDVWDAAGLLMRILEGSPFTQGGGESNRQVFEDFLSAFVNGCLQSKLATLEAVHRVINDEQVFQRFARAEFFRFSLYSPFVGKPVLEPRHLLKHALHTMLLTCARSLTGSLLITRPAFCQVMSEVVTKPTFPSEPGLKAWFGLLRTTACVFAGPEGHGRVERGDTEAFLRLFFPAQMHTPAWALDCCLGMPDLLPFWVPGPLAGDSRFVSYPGTGNYGVLFSFAGGLLPRLVQAPYAEISEIPEFSEVEARGFVLALAEVLYTSFDGGFPLNLEHFQRLFRAVPSLALPWLVQLGYKTHDVELRGNDLGVRIGANRLVLELVRDLFQAQASQQGSFPRFLSGWILRESLGMQRMNANPFASFVFRGAPELVRSQLQIVISSSVSDFFGDLVDTGWFRETVAGFLDVDSFQNFVKLFVE